MKWLVLSVLFATPASADHVDLLPAIEVLEACAESKASAAECVSFVYSMCEGSEHFGEVEGAGRGWCEGHVRDLWEFVVSRAENLRMQKYRECASKDTSLDLAILVATESANRAWRGHLEAECELAAVKDYRGVGSGESARTACLAQLSAQRLDALHMEREACE